MDEKLKKSLSLPTAFFIKDKMSTTENAAVTFIGSAPPPSAKLVLWYRQPATCWPTQALPIGNGYLAGMVFGGVESERIQFNEHSLWTGGPGEWSDYAGGNNSDKTAALATTRTLLEQKDYAGANNSVAAMHGDRTAFGAYQTFGDIKLDLTSPPATVSDYRRELDLDQGIARVLYIANGYTFIREYFCNYPDNVMVLRLTSSGPGQLSFDAKFTTPQSSPIITALGDLLSIRGALSNGMAYESQMKVINTNGTLSAGSNYIRVSNADSVTIIIAAGTDYINLYPTYKGSDPHTKVSNLISSAVKKGYNTLKANHLNDYQGIFGRVSLDIGQTMPTVPTDQQLENYKSARNSYLEVLLFQYGRYLLMSSSRPGTLPANLQGIWNDSTNPAWGSDNHVNINIQMNYWPAEVTNLSECALPLVDYTDKLRPRGRDTARLFFGAGGWTCGHEQNIFGHTGLSNWQTAFYFPGAAAWLCQHVYEHYLFMCDLNYLQNTAYPIMKEAAQFWVDYLYLDKDDNTLVSSPSYSPEHGNFSPGCTMDQSIAWDILTNTIEASLILGVDETFRLTMQTKKNQLSPLKIGSWGQLQEWKPDWDDPNDTHRHLSQLFALHPGRQISSLTTPDLLNAARVSLEHRTDGSVDGDTIGWSKAWKMNFRARLFDGNHALKLLVQMLSNGTIVSNLFDYYDGNVFQIDANFGITAGVAEMLLQSHMGFIHMLPALPDAWSAAGSVTGLKARSAFTVNEMKWSNSYLTEATITSDKDNTCQIKNSSFTGHVQVVKTSDNSAVSFTKNGDTITFATTTGTGYRIAAAANPGSAFN